MTDTGATTIMPRPIYSNVDRSWHLSHNDEYTFIEYHPVRLKVNKTGTCNLTLNRFLSENDNCSYNNNLVSV